MRFHSQKKENFHAHPISDVRSPLRSSGKGRDLQTGGPEFESGRWHRLKGTNRKKALQG